MGERSKSAKQGSEERERETKQDIISSHTKPFMQLPNPCLASLLNWGIEEDYLVLNSDFVNDWFERQCAFSILS